MKVINKCLIQAFKDGEVSDLLHGCNCQGKMKSGFAGALVKEFPWVAESDLMYNFRNQGVILGTADVVYIAGLDDAYVWNCYTQEFYGRDKNVVYVDYEALRYCFREVAQLCSPKDKIGYPKIGAGLANGDWNIISKIIDEELEGFDHALYVLEN